MTKQITVISAVSITALALVIFFNHPTIIENVNSTVFEHPALYDCAKTYDQLGHVSKGTSLLPFENDVMRSQFMAEKGLELWEKRCYITMESWAYNSEFQNDIWNKDLELLSYTNKLYLGEVEPRNDGEQKMIDNFKFSQKIVHNNP